VTESAATDKDGPNSVASLMKEAENGDASALSALKERLPEEIDTFLLEEYGELGQTAENALVKAVAGGNLLHVEGLKLKAQQMKADLAGPDPSPLERLLQPSGLSVAGYGQLRGRHVRPGHGGQVMGRRRMPPKAARQDTAASHQRLQGPGSDPEASGAEHPDQCCRAAG